MGLGEVPFSPRPSALEAGGRSGSEVIRMGELP